MSNWCDTEYIIIGNSESIHNLFSILEKLPTIEDPSYNEGDFGRMWCGNLVNILGGDWKEVYCRGWISDYKLVSQTNLQFDVISAWDELNDWRKFILTKYPDVTIYYYSEEPGTCIYKTNDVSGNYFPQRYIIRTNVPEEVTFCCRNNEELFSFMKRFSDTEITTVEQAELILKKEVLLRNLNHKYKDKEGNLIVYARLYKIEVMED